MSCKTNERGLERMFEEFQNAISEGKFKVAAHYVRKVRGMGFDSQAESMEEELKDERAYFNKYRGNCAYDYRRA